MNFNNLNHENMGIIAIIVVGFFLGIGDAVKRDGKI